MKTFIAVAIAMAVSAGGVRAYDGAVTPIQMAKLQQRVAALEAFNRSCLQQYRIYLTENADQVMAWGIGAPTPHSARFYGIPATAHPALAC